MRAKKLIPYYGGKSYLLKPLLQLLPKHKVYVEVFGGGATLLFNKPPSEVEVYNDINPQLCILMNVVKDPTLFPKFYEEIVKLPYTKEVFLHYRELLKDPTINKVQQAVATFVVYRMSWGSKGQTFNYNHPKRNKTKTWENLKKELPFYHKRLQNVTIENTSFENIFQKYDTPTTFFYCDPPYVEEKRKSKNKVYTYEMTLSDHQRLVESLQQVQGMVILSAYWHDVYQPLVDKGWIKLTQKVKCWVDYQEGLREETLLLSPNLKPLIPNSLF